jgi:hypothetical protein
LEANGVKAYEEVCKETLSPAMDILVSSSKCLMLKTFVNILKLYRL